MKQTTLFGSDLQQRYVNFRRRNEKSFLQKVNNKQESKVATNKKEKLKNYFIIGTLFKFLTFSSIS